MVWIRQHRGRHGLGGRRGPLGSDEGPAHHRGRRPAPASPHPLPAALPLRHQDPDHGPAGNPSQPAEGGSQPRPHPRRGEDAFHQDAGGDRGAGARSGHRIQDAHHGHGHHAPRTDGEVCRRPDRRHGQLLRRHDLLCHHLLAARRDHARQPLDGRAAGRQTGALRLRRRDAGALLL